MRKSLAVFISMLMMVSIFAGLPGMVQAALTNPSITVTPKTCNTPAQFQFTVTNSSQFNEIQIQFPATFTLPATIPTSAVYVMGTSITGVTVTGQTITITTNTYPASPPLVPYTLTVTLYNSSYNSAGIRNPDCANCGNQTITLTSIMGGAPNGSANFTYYVESKSLAATVVVDPPTTNSEAQYDMTFQLGAYGTLVAGDTITVTFPSGTTLPYYGTTIDPTDVVVRYGAALPPGSSFTPEAVAVSGSAITITVPTGVTINASDYVQIVFLTSLGIKNPYAAGYFKLKIHTSAELFMMESNKYMIGYHPEVTAFPNTAQSQNVEYKITWQIDSSSKLSGDAGDWIEVDWYHPQNPGTTDPPPVTDRASITNSFGAGTTPPPSSVYFQLYSYGTIYYATAVQFNPLNDKRLRIYLPAGFEVNGNTKFTITFLKSAGLNNTNTPGTYRLQMSHSRAPEQIPSDGYSIVDAVIQDSNCYVDVEPPTVSQVGQYSIKFITGNPGSLTGGSGTITIAFPQGTYFNSYQMGSGSVWLLWAPITNPLDADYPPDSGCNFDPDDPANLAFGPGGTGTLVPLDMNPSVSGNIVTITVPSGYTIPSDSYVNVRFCESAGVKNPINAGSYTLQIKTSTQPNYGISQPYLISTTISDLNVEVTPNATCSSNVQYKIEFNIGNSGSLDGDAGDYIDIDFDDMRNPAPDFASIQNTFDASTVVQNVTAYSSPPFTGWAARWDVWFDVPATPPGNINSVTIDFPPTVNVPTTMPAGSVYVSTAPMPLLDTVPPGPAVAVTPTIVGNRVTLPLGGPMSGRVYVRFMNTANVINPTAPGTSYTIQVLADNYPFPVPGYFGITNDCVAPTYVNPPAGTAQWTGHDNSIVPTVFPSSVSSPAQYDFSMGISAGANLGTATLSVTFPVGTIIPATIPAGSVLVDFQAGPPPLAPAFTFAQGCAGGVTVTATADPTTRTMTLTGLPAAAGPGTLFVRICATAGIRNPSNPASNNQLALTLSGTGAVGDGTLVMSEYYPITPPAIGGVGVPSNAIKIQGGYYYSGYASNYVSQVALLGPKTLRLWLPAGLKLQNMQKATVIFTDVMGLVNTCQPGSYILRARTSKELTWVTSNPYAIVDSVQFTCGTYPRVDPPTTGQTANYDISFTVGPMGGLEEDVDTITIAFPSMTQFTNYNMPAGGIYVSTLPIEGDCPPSAPAQVVEFNPTVSGTEVTIRTPIPIGNGETVFIRFCKSAGIKNPFTAGIYSLQVKTSAQPNYAKSCLYAIGTAISNVKVEVNPASACNPGAEYSITFNQGSSGGLKGENGDYIDIDFDHPNNINGPSIQNNFLDPAQRPSPSTVLVSPYGYSTGYGAKTASMIVALGPKKLRVYVPTSFTSTASGQINVKFLTGAGLINTCIPGSYKLKVNTSLEQNPVSSEPYAIEDAVTFDPGIPVEVEPPTISKEAQYTITFRVGTTGALQAGIGTITIAFPQGTTVPYTLSPGTIWVGRGTQFTNNVCPPSHAGILGTDYSQVVLPPTVSSQAVTITTPITINAGDLVTIRFCRTAGIKNPYTAGAYRLQVKTSKQPAYAVSYPYAITSAISDVKFEPNPNTACTEDVEYKITFKNGNNTLSGDLGDYIEIDWEDSKNPPPDYASIQNIFAASGAIKNLHIHPLTLPIIGTSPGGSSRYDINFTTGVGGGLTTGDIITIDFPSNTTFTAATLQAAGVYLSDARWTDYSYYPGDLQIGSTGTVVGPLALADINVVGTRATFTVPAGFSVPDSGSVYLRIMQTGITNPSTPANNYMVQAFTSLQTTPVSSNNFGIVSVRPTRVATSVDLNWPTTPHHVPPKVYPSNAGANSQIDVEAELTFGLNVNGPTQWPTVSVTLPVGFSVPSVISQNNIWVSVGPSPVGYPFLNNSDFHGTPTCSFPATQGVDFGPLDAPPTVNGNTITFNVPAFFIGNANAGAGGYMHIQIGQGAGIRNPANAATDTYILDLSTVGGSGAIAPYGVTCSSEFIAITPENDPVGASTIATTSVVFGSSYGTTVVNPSSIVVLDNKRVRLYLPLGYQITASATATITFLPSAGLVNTCTPGSYIGKVQTSKEPTDIESAPYQIIGAVSEILVKVVPPIVSQKADYTITMHDTSDSGLEADRSTITIAFPTGTTIPANIAAGAVFVARKSDFNNDTCPPTHPGVYGVDYAPLHAPPTVSGQTVTLTVPIDIDPGDLIAIRFCRSAGLQNPGTAKYYQLQVMTSSQPTYSVSKPYAIVTGLKRPKVKVEPNVISRTGGPGCTEADTTIEFTNGASGALEAGIGRIFVCVEAAALVTDRGYFNLPATIPAATIYINGTPCTVNAIVHYPPTGSYIPDPQPSFTNMATIELVTPIDLKAAEKITIKFTKESGICNPYVAGNYTLAVWTDVETAAYESEPYSIVDGVWVMSVDVQPPTIDTMAQYTIEFTTYVALTANTSTVTVTFPEDTDVRSLILPGHIIIDNDNNFGNDPGDPSPAQAALPPVTVNGQSVTFTLPTSFPAGGTIYVQFTLESGITNPTTEGAYTLFVRTSAQPNDVESPPYYIIASLQGAIVTVDPPISNYPNAAYTIDFDLSDKGGLTGHISWIKLTFPDNDINGAGGGYATVEAQLPPSIAPANIVINGVVATEAPSVNLTERSIKITVPESVEAGEHITLKILAAAGITNPVEGSYRLKLQTSVEPIDVETAIYTITSALGGPLAGRNPIVVVSYVVATTTVAAAAGDTVVNVDGTVGWKTGTYAAVGDLINLYDSQIVRITGVGPGSLTFTQPLLENAPAGTNIFMLKSMEATFLTANIGLVATSISVNDATPFVGEAYLLIGPTDENAELCRIVGVDILTNTIQVVRSTTPTAHVAGDNVFLLTNKVGLVNNEAYYGFIFTTGATGVLKANISTVTITFPYDTEIPDYIAPYSIDVSTDGNIFRDCSSVSTDSTARTVTFTTPINIDAGQTAYVRIFPQAGIRNPALPGTYRVKIQTSTEPNPIDSLAYYMEGTGAPTVSVDPCTVGEVGAKYTIRFPITVGLVQGAEIFVTFPLDTIMPSVLRQENVLINGMRVVQPITLTPGTLELAIPTPKALPASSMVEIVFTSEARIKNPSSIGNFRLKVRTSQIPDDVDVDSLAYYICPKLELASLVLIPQTLSIGTSQSGSVQAQAKDANGENITYNVNYAWSTDIGTLAGATGDSVTVTAPATPGTGTLKCKATYMDKTLEANCPITVTPPIGSVVITPPGPLTLGFGVAQNFSAQAKDTAGQPISGALYKWSINGGVGSLSAGTGQTTTLTTSSTASTGSVTVEATYAGIVKSSAASVSIQSSGGGGSGGGGDGGGGDGGGGTTTSVSASIEPTSHPLGTPLSMITVSVTSLADLSGGEIRVTVPSGWTMPNTSNTRIPSVDGVTYGNISYQSSVIVIPVTTMPAGKTVRVLFVDPQLPSKAGAYKFSVMAKNSAGVYTYPTTQPTLTLIDSGGGTGTNPAGEGICTVTPNKASAGAIGAKFKFIFTARADISNGEIQLQIPTPDWTPPTDSPGAKGYVKIVKQTGEVTALQILPGGIISLVLGNFLANHTVEFEYTNVDVPDDEKTYTFNVKTAGSLGGPKGIANPPQVTVERTRITAVTCKPTPNSAGAAASYLVTFRTSDAGTLTKDQSMIVIKFPSDTTVPSSMSPSTVTVQKVPLVSPPTINADTRSVQIVVPTDVPPNSTVSIEFEVEAGILNPTEPRTNYMAEVKTSSDASNVNSSKYAITASTISKPKVTPNPVVVDVEAEYTIMFKTGGSGALQLGTGQIIVKFPNDTFIPPNILPTKITVNGSVLTKRPEVDTVARKVAFYAPAPIKADSDVTVVFTKEAGIKNPTSAGQYTLWVSTTEETIEVESDAYGIGSSTVGNVQVTSTSLDAGDTCVDYTVTFTTGQFGALTAASDITIAMHPNYKIGSITANRITVNNLGVSGTPTVREGQYITFSCPTSVNAGTEIKVVIKCLNNPTTPGQYDVKVRTSSEPTYVASNSYNIGQSLMTNATISPPNPDGDNGWYKSNPSITFDCNISTAVTWYELDSAGKKQWTGVPVRLNDGVHNVRYWSEALGYNEEAPQFVNNVKVDTVKPILNIEKPLNGETFSSARLELSGTFVEDNLLEISVSINQATNRTSMQFDKNSGTWSGTLMLVKGTNTLDIKAFDEAGNESFTPIITVKYDPSATGGECSAIVLSPRDNTQPSGGVKLVNEAQAGYHHLEMTFNVDVTIDGCTDPKIEVSSEMDSENWVEMKYDAVMKKVKGDVTLKAKAGNNKVSIRITGPDGKSSVINRVLICNVKTEFVNPKGFTSAGATSLPPAPDKMLHNGTAITNLDSYPYIEQSEGRTYVPLRLLGNLFGGVIGYDGNTRTANITFEGKRVEIVLGASTATVIEGGNKTTIPLDKDVPGVTAKIIQGRLYVPLRFAETVFGWKLTWDAVTRTVTFEYP